MNVTNKQKTQLAIRYAKHLLDEVGVLSKDKQRSLTYYGKRINQLRGDLKIVNTKKASRDYLFHLFVNNKGLVN